MNSRISFELEKISVHPAKTALIIIDMQNDFVKEIGECSPDQL